MKTLSVNPSEQPLSWWLHPRRMLTIAGKILCRRRPTPERRRWVRTSFRKWCVDEEIVVGTPFGFQIAASPRDYASSSIYFFGDYDPLMTSVVRHFVREGQIAFDIGTDRGWFSLLMGSCVGPSGEVHAIEALPQNADRLRSNLALNGMSWVHVQEKAICDRSGTATFHLPTHDVIDDFPDVEHCSGVGYLTDIPSTSTITVPTLTLDEYVAERGIRRIDFLKMDIEGAEVSAFRGATNVLQRLRPIIAVEYNRITLERAGTSLQDLDEILNSLDYDRFELNGQFRKLSLDRYKDVPDHHAVFNVYAFPR
jgi:FkbM family methyltransferase